MRERLSNFGQRYSSCNGLYPSPKQTRALIWSNLMKTHPDGRPWEYPWDSWRDGPHFSVGYLRRIKPTGDADAELIKALLVDPKLPHLFPNEDYLRRYVVHITPNLEEQKRRLAAVPTVWRQYRSFWRKAQNHGRPRAEHDRRIQALCMIGPGHPEGPHAPPGREAALRNELLRALAQPEARHHETLIFDFDFPPITSRTGNTHSLYLTER